MAPTERAEWLWNQTDRKCRKSVAGKTLETESQGLRYVCVLPMLIIKCLMLAVVCPTVTVVSDAIDCALDAISCIF